MRLAAPVRPRNSLAAAVCVVLLVAIFTATGPVSVIRVAASAERPSAECTRAGLVEAQQRFVQKGQVRVAYVRCGAGSPVVVFEGGFGGDLIDWEGIFPKVAEFAAAFTYSRPGFGNSVGHWSGDDDAMRTSEETADLLHQVLHAARVPPPYLLVGYSLGGLYVQKFAQRYPQETAALVLVDNRPATYMAECRGRHLPQCQHLAPAAEWSTTLKNTFAGIEPSEAVAPSPEDLGDLPVTVITAGGESMPDAPEFMDGFRKAQAAFAMRLRHGCQIRVAGATHDSFASTNADVVIDAIRQRLDSLAGEARGVSTGVPDAGAGAGAEQIADDGISTVGRCD